MLVDTTTVKDHPRLLVSGVWCIADLGYEYTEDKNVSPWVLSGLKPIQLSQFDFEGYVEARKQFTFEEWIDLLMQSIGFNPEMFDLRRKLIQLVRLITFCERNYNFIELGPKGTGKSHIFSEFSPHGILLSGGEVTVAKLFVNNATGKIGLVGYWDCVAFDEFAGKKKSVDKALVDILKNYMANKSFSRGVETLGRGSVNGLRRQHAAHGAGMLKHYDLFCDLPEKFYDSAFLDRIHAYVPVGKLTSSAARCSPQATDSWWIILPRFFARCAALITRTATPGTFRFPPTFQPRSRRDHKTFSGLMKILHPGGEADKDEMEGLLRFAIEGRKRVKDQLLRMIPRTTAFASLIPNADGESRAVTTREEERHPGFITVPAVSGER